MSAHPQHLTVPADASRLPMTLPRLLDTRALGHPLVMGHVGLTPQTSTALGGYKAQGRDAGAATRIAREAVALQEAGCFSIVFEAIPSDVTAEIMTRMEVPVIGIGAGPATDGQVLV